MRGVVRRVCVSIVPLASIVALVGAGSLLGVGQVDVLLPEEELPCYWVYQDPPGYLVEVCPPV